MSAAAIDATVWRPPRTERYGIGATLALLAHAALVAALAVGLQWRIKSPPVFSAELWSAVPQVAAPAAAPAAPAPPPKPTPAPPRAVAPSPPAPAARDAEIAAERARAEKRRAQEAAEQEQARKAAEHKAREAAAAKAAEDKRQRDLKAVKEAEAEERRIAKTREENLKRMLAQAGSSDAGGSTPSGTAAKDGGPSAELAGRIKARIKPNIKLLTEVAGNPIAEVEVRCAPDGTIIARRIVKPSGNAVWDETVLRAIDSTRMLPRDTDGRIPALMILVFPRQE